ncbi:MAG: hypothetical protein DI556_04130 [Rhodovulum sulfidophilum]|uniref:Omptin family outer membrane protease n=1 Tax=Rhodovulum sulfidophilum TaxID=35806 RepID=A0A2W5Q9E6_RHOSU|nr:MAG: hypothetical protein DI556_04130 [Rhodovulum sulfidophilum]
MIKTHCLGLSVAACLAAADAYAETSPPAGAATPAAVTTRSFASRVLSDRLSVEGYLGYLSGESKELVYFGGQKQSQLDWTIESAAVVGGRLDYAATGWLTIGVGGWTSLAGDVSMVDYDWLWRDSGYEGWTDRSRHPNTSLERAFEFDLAAAARVAEWNGVWVNGLLGYQVRNFKFQASDGDYLYSTFKLHDTEGRFQGPMVDYQQWWRTPYVGVAAGYAMPRWRLSGKVIASPFAQVSDADLHIENQQLFTGDFGDTQMAAVTLRAEHDLTESLMLTAMANYQRFWEARGDLTAINVAFPEFRSEIPDGAGASNETLILSLGLAYRF